MYSFPVSASEEILKKGLANLHSSGDSFSGALYLTTERLVFIGYISDATHKFMEEVPLGEISELTQGKSLFLIPNVIGVQTTTDKSLKFVVRGRNSWFQEINKKITENS